MDVLMLGSCVAIASTARTSLYQEQEYDRTAIGLNKKSQQSYGTSIKTLLLGLSLALFSLNLLEFCPQSWLLLLEQHEYHRHHDMRSLEKSQHRLLSVSKLYQVLLWSLTLVIVVVLPAHVGASICQHFYTSLTTSRQRNAKQDEIINSRRTKSTSKGIIPFLWRILWLVLLLLWRFILCLIMPTFHLLGKKIFKPIINFTRGTFLHRGAILPSTSLHQEKTSKAAHATFQFDETHPQSHYNSTLLYKLTFPALCGSLLGIATMGLIFSTVSPLFVSISLPNEDEHSWLASLVSWCCAMGFLISSLINGFGCVSLPLNCLGPFYVKHTPPAVIKRAQAELQNLIQARENKLVELHTTGATKVGTVNNNNSSPSIMGKASVVSKRRSSSILAVLCGTPLPQGSNHQRKSFSDFAQDEIKRRQTVANEIEFMDTLIEDLKQDIIDIKLTQDMAISPTHQKTILKRVRFIVGVIGSVILLVRLAHTLFFLVASALHQQERDFLEQHDLITTLLAKALSFFSTENNGGNDDPQQQQQRQLEMYSEMVSLGLTVILSMTQIRTLMQTINTLHRRFKNWCRKTTCLRPICSNHLSPRKQQGDVESGQDATTMAPPSTLFIISLLVSDMFMGTCMGCYCLSCILLMKLNLPLQYRLDLVQAIMSTGTLSATTTSLSPTITIYFESIQWVFGLSAVLSGVILGMLLAITRENMQRHIQSFGGEQPKETGQGMLQ